MTPRRILVLGWLVFLLYAYPGYMTLDGLDMLVDARYGSYTDWHSPVMTAVWNVVNTVITGPPGMLLLQSGGLLFGGYVLLRRVMSDRAAAYASAAVLVFPPVMAAMGVVGRDGQLVGFLVAAAALFTSERRWRRLVGLGLVVLACGMRDGAWLAAFPVVVFGFWWRADHRPAMRYAIALNAWIVAALLAAGLGHVLVDRHTHRSAAALAMVDIAGTLARTGELTDAQVRELAPGVRFAVASGIQQRARELAGRPDELATGLFDDPRKQAKPLIAARAALRRHDPGAYAGARWEHWKRILNLEKRTRSPVYTKDSVSRHLRVAAAHGARPSPLQKLLQRVVRAFAWTPLFSPFVYLAVAFAVFPLALRDRMAAILLGSGIALTLALAIVTADVEYRYSTWPIVATVLALVIVIRRRTASASPGSS